MAALALARLAVARKPLLAECGRLPALIARRFASAPPPVVSSQLVSERLVEVSKRIRNLVDLKKLDKALDTFHEAFEDADAAAAGRRGAADGKAAGRVRRSTLRPDILVFNSLLRGFVDAGRLNAARDIVAWMRDKYGVTPSEATWSLLMEGVALHGTRADLRNLLTTLAQVYPPPVSSSGPNQGGGWRSVDLLSRRSFVRWLLRACARLAYAAPADLHEAVLTAASESNAQSAAPTHSLPSSTRKVAPETLECDDFFEVVESLRAAAPPASASAPATTHAPDTAQAPRPLPVSPSLSGLDLLDTHWVSACSLVLHACALSAVAPSQRPDPASAGAQQHWLLCGHALTAEATAHILAGIVRRNESEALIASPSSSTAGLRSAAESMLADALLFLHWRASIFSLVSLPKGGSLAAAKKSVSSAFVAAASSSLATATPTDLDANAIDVLLRVLRRAKEVSAAVTATLTVQAHTQRTHLLQTILSPLLVTRAPSLFPVAMSKAPASAATIGQMSNAELIASLSSSSQSATATVPATHILSRCFSAARASIHRFVFGFSHPLFAASSPTAPSAAQAPVPTWLQVGCKRSHADLAIELACGLQRSHTLLPTRPADGPATAQTARLFVLEKATPNVSRLMALWLSKFRSLVFPDADAVDSPLAHSLSPQSHSVRPSRTVAASADVKSSHIQSALRAAFPSAPASATASAASTHGTAATAASRDLTALAGALRVWFPTAGDLRATFGIVAARSRSRELLLRKRFGSSANATMVAAVTEEQGGSAPSVNAVDDLTTAQLISTLPKGSFAGALFVFPPPPAKAAKVAASANGGVAGGNESAPSFMAQPNAQSGISGMDEAADDDSSGGGGGSGAVPNHRQKSKEEFAAWKAQKRSERRDERRQAQRLKAEAKTKLLVGSDSAAATTTDADQAAAELEAARATVATMARDKEWVLCAATFDRLRERVPVGGIAILVSDDTEVRAWAQSTFVDAHDDELRAAVRDFHKRTGLSPNFAGQLATDAGYDDGSRDKAESGTGWLHAATLTLPALLKLSDASSPASSSFDGHRGGAAAKSKPSRLEAALGSVDDDCDLDSDAADADAEASTRARSDSAHQLVKRLSAPAAHMIASLAHADVVKMWANHPHRSHTKFIVLQRV